MSELALTGGQPVRVAPFPAYRVIDSHEVEAVREVMETGILSRYLGAWHKDFFGGPQIQAFEKEWADALGSRHAIAVNSCTSGLYAAVGAAGAGPADEVIVSPFSMSASATAPIIFNAVPVFADIDAKTYCLDPESIREKITPRTKAIIVVHIFGQAADMDPIMDLAREHGLVVIEDCAQAPFARYKGKPVGTLGHIGVFSLNYHKHIHTGEGGVIVTNDDNLCDRMQLIRNHAEAVLGRRDVDSLVNLVGFNFRLGEIEAAIGRQQLAKVGRLIEERQANVQYLEQQLAGLPGIKMPHVSSDNTHVYYLHVLDYDEAEAGFSRQLFVEAIKAELPVTELREGEGPLMNFGYTKPLYMLPMFQQKTAFGDKNCPFECPHYEGQADYNEGLCPVTEESHNRVITHEFIRPQMSKKDLDDVASAFFKVMENRDKLRNQDASSTA